YKPTMVSYAIPNTPTASGVNGAFTYVYTYDRDGSLATTRIPGLGDPGMGLETLSHGYNELGKPVALSTTLGGTLVDGPEAGIPGTEYTSLGELAVIHLRHNGGARADLASVYDTDTRRLAQIWTTRATAPTTVADVRYSYDPIGNITKISDLTTSDHQCFRTDYLRRLQEAWTPADDSCASAPSAGALGGPARYWHSYSYDVLGNRVRLLEHATSTGDRDTTYTVPVGAHRLTGATTIDSTGTRSRTYTYDPSGNLVSRPSETAGIQTMTWDAEGHLATSHDASGTTSYIYDPDGNRLVRSDPGGKTLYLPGQELRYSAADASKKSTRYYIHARQMVAMRTAAAGVVWVSSDHHGTAQIAITAAGQAVSTRRETPFGGLRSSTGTWPTSMDKGFIGGTVDSASLTHLGAREYDLGLGRFISVDPIFDGQDPQSWNGFAYSNNNPVTMSDPDGTMYAADGGSAPPNTKACSDSWECQRLVPSTPTKPSPPGDRGQPTPHPSPSAPGSGRGGGKNTASGPGGPGGCVRPTSPPDATNPCARPTAPPDNMAGNRRKGSFFGLRMVGVCPFAGGISTLIGVSASACIGVDAKGARRFESYGASVGPQAGGFLGMSMVASTGDIDDQKGKFDFWEGSAGQGAVGFGSYAWSGNVRTFHLGAGWGFGAPLNLGRGVSYTFVHRRWPW
ncbi:MAG: RHS repeat domain-containing protein, partial [bacterium]